VSSKRTQTHFVRILLMLFSLLASAHPVQAKCDSCLKGGGCLEASPRLSGSLSLPTFMLQVPRVRLRTSTADAAPAPSPSATPDPSAVRAVSPLQAPGASCSSVGDTRGCVVLAMHVRSQVGTPRPTPPRAVRRQLIQRHMPLMVGFYIIRLSSTSGCDGQRDLDHCREYRHWERR
jgi:hypothetical protein